MLMLRSQWLGERHQRLGSLGPRGYPIGQHSYAGSNLILHGCPRAGRSHELWRHPQGCSRDVARPSEEETSWCL